MKLAKWWLRVRLETTFEDVVLMTAGWRVEKFLDNDGILSILLNI